MLQKQEKITYITSSLTSLYLIVDILIPQLTNQNSEEYFFEKAFTWKLKQILATLRIGEIKVDKMNVLYQQKNLDWTLPYTWPGCNKWYLLPIGVCEYYLLFLSYRIMTYLSHKWVNCICEKEKDYIKGSYELGLVSLYCPSLYIRLQTTPRKDFILKIKNWSCTLLCNSNN